jgi:hypothetical protein
MVAGITKIKGNAKKIQVGTRQLRQLKDIKAKKGQVKSGNKRTSSEMPSHKWKAPSRIVTNWHIRGKINNKFRINTIVRKTLMTEDKNIKHSFGCEDSYMTIENL